MEIVMIGKIKFEYSENKRLVTLRIPRTPHENSAELVEFFAGELGIFSGGNLDVVPGNERCDSFGHPGVIFIKDVTTMVAEKDPFKERRFTIVPDSKSYAAANKLVRNFHRCEGLGNLRFLSINRGIGWITISLYLDPCCRICRHNGKYLPVKLEQAA
jgi:hypothetical protein